MTPEDLKKLLVNTGFRPDDGLATHLIHACATTGLPISYGLALVQKESGFHNVFGHDPTRSIPDKWKGSTVTRAKYSFYKVRRRAGQGMQGVGYTQLTWFALQDDADKVGGCWKAYPNMVVGFRHLKQLIAGHNGNLGAGAAAYNGAGPAAVAYGEDFVIKQRHWHQLVS